MLNNVQKYKIASFFAGCGGSDLGLLGGFDFLDNHYTKNPIEIVYANDIDKDAVVTYRHNFGEHITCNDIRNIQPSDLPEFDILVGGFPCQTFSMIGQRKGLDDPRGELYYEMTRILKAKKPLAFIGENVKGLVNLRKGAIFQQIISDFESVGYNVAWKILNASNYGIPQKRERVFIVGFRKDLSTSFKFPEPSNILVPLGKVVQLNFDDKYIFSERAVQGLKNSNKAFNKGRVQNLDAPSNTINSHLAKVSLNGTDPVLAIDIEKDIYRRFTPLEAARIQSFPDTFEFPVSEYQAYKQIGNAIPPVLMWQVTKEIIKTLSSAIFSKSNVKIPEKGQSYEL
jgi:DNA (cytosine-5)-methyltransferase 1